jgi:hypothetical protein
MDSVEGTFVSQLAAARRELDRLAVPVTIDSDELFDLATGNLIAEVDEPCSCP